MNNKHILKVLSSLAFVVSAIFTVRLLTGTSVGVINTILITLMGVIFEFSKCFFLYKSIDKPKNVNSVVRNFSAIVVIFLFGVSILASLSFLQNETNKNKNKSILKSDGYKQQVQAKEQLNDLYNNKKAQIVSLQEQTKQQVQALAGQRDSMPSNYITRKANINKQISSLQSESNKQIAIINSKLDTIVSKQSETINIKDIAFNSEKGYSAFLEVVAKQVSNEDITYSVEELEVILFSLIAICFEFVAVLLYYYNKRSEVSVEVEEVQETMADATPVETPKNIAPITPIRKSGIGFQYDNSIQAKKQENTSSNISPKILEPELRHTDIILKKYGCIDKKTVTSYLVNAEKSKAVKNNGHEISGVQVLAKECNVSENSAKNVFGYLKHLGIIEVKNRSSFLVKAPEEYKKILEL